jgi:ankyrin repeat protein
MNIHKFPVGKKKFFFKLNSFFFVEVIRYIFKFYPNKINIQNDEHRTPLHLAASLGDIDTCQVLIKSGARINSFIRTSSVS